MSDTDRLGYLPRKALKSYITAQLDHTTTESVTVTKKWLFMINEELLVQNAVTHP